MKTAKYYLIGVTLLAGVALIFIASGCGGGPEVSSGLVNNFPGPVGPAGQNGKDGSNGSDGKDGVNGTNGTNGSNGSNGINGLNSLITTMPALSTQCSSGGTVVLTGLDSNRDGNLSVSEVVSSATICNGTNGSQGIQGVPGATGPVSAFSPINPIQPCGANSSPYKEVLLCLFDGNVLASFSDNMAGSNTRFAFIPSGSYIDTDDSACAFTVNVDSHGNTTVSWAAGHNSYSTWTAGSSTCTAN